MTVETELKLELTAKGAGVVVASSLLQGKSTRTKQSSIYFDTSDRLLSKAGISLRIRQSKGARIQTVKAAGSGAAGLFVRSEWEQKVDDDRPMLEYAKPVQDLLCKEVHKLGPIFKVDINRQIWVIQEDETLIEVALDRGEVFAGDRSCAICEIELELKAGISSALFAFARKVDAIAPVHLGVLSKAERGDRLCDAIVCSVKAEPLFLEKDMTAIVAFQKIAGANLRQFRLNEALIQHQNPDALHHARVGLRRLRSAITIFKPIIVDEEYPLIRDGLRWLSGELGKARNLDVVAARATAQPLHDVLEAARIDAYSSVADTLQSARARALMIKLAEWIADGCWLSNFQARAERTQPLDILARDILRRSRKRLKKAGNLGELDDAQRHRVRKDTKKLRYASEFFGSLFDDKIARRRQKRFIKALDRLQNKLGALNDFAVVPAVLQNAGLEDNMQTEILLTVHKKPHFLAASAKAYDDLLDAKIFWK